MLLLRKEHLPEGPEWMYEIKLDCYRALAIKSGGAVQLRSRTDNDFGARYPRIAAALARLPDETVVDGEVVALGEDGRPSFNVLQNYGSSRGELLFSLFDVLILAGHDVMTETLSARRALLEKARPAAPARAHPRFRGPAPAPLRPCPVSESPEA